MSLFNQCSLCKAAYWCVSEFMSLYSSACQGVLNGAYMKRTFLRMNEATLCNKNPTVYVTYVYTADYSAYMKDPQCHFLFPAEMSGILNQWGRTGFPQ